MHHWMSRKAFKLVSRQLAFASTMTVAAAFLYPPILLEGAAETKQEKLPIYDPLGDGQEIIVVREKTALEERIRSGRQFVQVHYSQLENTVQSGVEKWLGVEKNVESTIRSIIPKDEPLLPGAIYVGISGLAGTILVRQRGILLRFTTPLVLSLTSAYYFLPKTTINTVGYLEDRFPSLRRTNDALLKKVHEASSQIESLVSSVKDTVSSTVDGGKKLVKERTGLQIGDSNNAPPKK